MIPVDLQFKFGGDFSATDFNPSDVLTHDLTTRIGKILNGQYEIDEAGRCYIYDGDWDSSVETRDSVCVGVNLGIGSVSYCFDIK